MSKVFADSNSLLQKGMRIDNVAFLSQTLQHMIARMKGTPSDLNSLYHLLSTHKDVQPCHIWVTAASRKLVHDIEYRRKLLGVLDSRKLVLTNLADFNGVIALEGRLPDGLPLVEKRILELDSMYKLPIVPFIPYQPNHETLCVLIDASDLAEQKERSDRYFSLLLSYISRPNPFCSLKDCESIVHRYRSYLPRVAAIFDTLIAHPIQKMRPDFAMYRNTIRFFVNGGKLPHALEYADAMAASGISLIENLRKKPNISNSYKKAGDIEVELRMLANDRKMGKVVAAADYDAILNAARRDDLRTLVLDEINKL